VHDHRIDGAVAALLLLDGLGDLASLLFEALDRGDGGLMRALSPLDARAGSGELRRLGGAVAQDAVVVLGGFADGFKRRACGGGTRRVRGDVDGNGARGGADPRIGFGGKIAKTTPPSCDGADPKAEEEGVRSPRLWFLCAISRSRGGERPRPRDGDVPPLRERLGLVAEDMARGVSVVCAQHPPVRLDSTGSLVGRLEITRRAAR
jgi:hypothetical protein